MSKFLNQQHHLQTSWGDLQNSLMKQTVPGNEIKWCQSSAKQIGIYPIPFYLLEDRYVIPIQPGGLRQCGTLNNKPTI